MRFLLAILRISLFLLLFITDNSTAQNDSVTSNCPPSSCGNVRNIRFPFRLKSDPRSCGYEDPNFELDCQNDRAILNVRSRMYFVQEINYLSFTIRLVDPGIKKGNLSSCPSYFIGYYYWEDHTVFENIQYLNRAVAFIRCLSPASSANYVEAAFCGNKSSLYTNFSEFHSYVLAMEYYYDQILELEDFCTIAGVNWVSLRLPMRDNSSLLSIYDGLAYGFELAWHRIFCGECKGFDSSCTQEGNTYTCRRYCPGNILLSPENNLVEEGFKCTLAKIWKSVIAKYCRIAIASLLGLRFLCGFPFLVTLVVKKWKKRHLSVDETIEEFLQGQNNLTPIKYSYSEIKKMTNNFNQRLGEGGFGTVYKGKLRSGPYVAIKMMDQSMASEQEFISEVGTIGRIHHVNVVQLIGFCVESSKCALVYEYLPNGSLDRYIFSQQSLDVLALRYEKMFQIALGVARGVDYLHRGCDVQILHFDIKPHNILLDENFNPKISDFGLSKLYQTEGSTVNITAARGTMGYMAPEMFYKNIGGVSYKADVYSFGML